MVLKIVMVLASLAQFSGAFLLLMTGPGIAARVIEGLQDIGRLHFDDMDRRTLESIDEDVRGITFCIVGAVLLWVVAGPLILISSWFAAVQIASIAMFVTAIRLLTRVLPKGRAYVLRVLIKLTGTKLFTTLRVDTRPELALTYGLVLVVLGTGLQAAGSLIDLASEWR